MINFALSLYDRGILTIPVTMPLKVPPKNFEWRKFAESKPSREVFLSTWQQYYNENTGIALPCGEIEMFEADIKSDPDKTIHTRLYQAIKAQLPPELFAKLYIQNSPSGGIHFWYRVPADQVLGNTKLAEVKYDDAYRFELGLGENQKGIGTLVETRGLGGYALIAPTPNYTVIQGDISDLPLLTADERDFIWMIGRSFNAYDEEAQVFQAKQWASTLNGKRPGDVYNEQVDPIGLLNLVESYGFRRLKQLGDSIFLSRPGARHANKHDAKINVRLNCFVNYSSSVPDFIPMKGYSPFYVYAYLAHNGNFGEATKALAATGYEHPDHKSEYLAQKQAQTTEQASGDYIPAFGEEVQQESAVERLQHLRFSLKDRPKMTYTLFVESNGKLVGVGFPGAIIAVFGQAKARKTTMLGAIIASAFADRKVLNFRFTKPGRILWIDTEQGDLYFWDTIKRMHIQARIKEDDPDKLYAYKFVDMTYQERLQNTEQLINEIQPSIIILDGIVDYLRNFNDETESLAIVTRMRKWAATGAMIFPVLHLNPGKDSKARGHLGTMLQNKCDSAIEVRPVGDGKERVSVRHSFSRGPQFDTFELIAGKFGILYADSMPDYDFTVGDIEAEDAKSAIEVPVISPDTTTFEDIPF